MIDQPIFLFFRSENQGQGSNFSRASFHFPVLFLSKHEFMPLSRRRRRKPAQLHSVREPATPPHPPGRSPLEELPVEIFDQIFCESQNIDFVLTSKTIFARLGYPSDSLVLAFFQCFKDGIAFSNEANVKMNRKYHLWLMLYTADVSPFPFLSNGWIDTAHPPRHKDS